MVSGAFVLEKGTTFDVALRKGETAVWTLC